ncbi:MAG: hypothetical protein ABIJ45_05910 [Candidatus Zixiibacteriota bacterium]
MPIRLNGSALKAANNIIIWYLLLLIAYQAHLFEEIVGDFAAISVLGSVTNFLIVNLLIFCIFVFTLYHLIAQKRWAYKLAIFLAIGMTLNGIGHNVAYWFNISPFGGPLAGEYSGLALIIIGPILAVYLKRGLGNFR